MISVFAGVCTTGVGGIGGAGPRCMSVSRVRDLAWTALSASSLARRSAASHVGASGSKKQERSRDGHGEGAKASEVNSSARGVSSTRLVRSASISGLTSPCTKEKKPEG